MPGGPVPSISGLHGFRLKSPLPKAGPCLLERTIASTRDWRSAHMLVSRFAPRRLLASLQERHADLVAVHPGELAVAIGKAGRRQHEKELGELQPLDRGADRELGAVIRYVVEAAFAPPGAVDRHQLRRWRTLEGDALVATPLSAAHAGTSAAPSLTLRRGVLSREIRRPTSASS